MKYATGAVGIVLLLLVATGSASGALTDWGSGQVRMVTDADEGFMPGREILQAWHKYDAGTHYFRIDLETAPMGPPHLPPSFAGIYGFAINTDLASGADGFHPYLAYAPNVQNIDYLIDAHYESFSPYPNPAQLLYSHYHDWEDTAFAVEPLDSVGGQFQRSGPSTLEWSIADDLIGSPGATRFSWCAYSLDAGSETAKYDLACSFIPEPLTMLAFGMGLAGVGGYVRRRIKG